MGIAFFLSGSAPLRRFVKLHLGPFYLNRFPGSRPHRAGPRPPAEGRPLVWFVAQKRCGLVSSLWSPLFPTPFVSAQRKGPLTLFRKFAEQLFGFLRTSVHCLSPYPYPFPFTFTWT
jgi:hypothetical protein